jgi:hypothetical protein
MRQKGMRLKQNVGVCDRALAPFVPLQAPKGCSPGTDSHILLNEDHFIN